MKAYLIDPFNMTVTQVEHDGGYKDILKHIQAPILTALTVNEYRDTLYLDDEGLYRKNQRYFMWVGYHQPLAGRALLLGTDEMGDSKDPVMPIESVMNYVAWPQQGIKFAGMETETKEGVDMPFGGKGVHISNTPIFDIIDDKED